MPSIGWSEHTNVKHCGTPDTMTSAQKDTQIGLRVPRSTRDAWAKAAETDGRSLSSWIVARCNGLPTSAPVLDADEDEPPRRRRKTR